MLFEQIAHNRRNTRIVVALFSILLLAVTVFLGYFNGYLALIVLVAGIVYVTYNYYHVTRYLMKVTNSQEVSAKSDPQLYEIVEELCLAGGLPMPKVYIDPDPLPNAYATGRDPEHASLAVTQGLLDIMDKHELAGVIGHELSHIRNYDTKLTSLTNIMLTFLVGLGLGILSIGAGLFTIDGNGLLTWLIRAFGLIVLGIGLAICLVAIPLGKILYFILSRQREYLADAGSVDLTRDPSGLISALEKLRDPELAPLPSKNMTLNNLYFNGPKKSNILARLFDDHPALDKRIARLKESASAGK